MKTFLRRHLLLVAVTAASVVGAVVGWYDLGDFQQGTMRLRFAFLGAGLIGGAVLAIWLLTLLVTLDPEKPRSLSHQNHSATRYGPPPTDHSRRR